MGYYVYLHVKSLTDQQLLAHYTSYLNFLSCVARRHHQDIRAWLTAALTAERITTTVIRGGHLGAAHDVQQE